jgi:hypothetical protein
MVVVVVEMMAAACCTHPVTSPNQNVGTLREINTMSKTAEVEYRYNETFNLYVQTHAYTQISCLLAFLEFQCIWLYSMQSFEEQSII